MNVAKRNQNVSFPSIFDSFFKSDWGNELEREMNIPSVNILENNNNFEILLSAPGRKKEDFNLEVDNNVLTISSSKEDEKTAEKGKYTRREYSYTSFSRSFTLPDAVIEDDINAIYEDGILKIVIPKKEQTPTKAKKLIEIA